MEAIEGIDLVELVREAENDVLIEKRRRVYQMVKGINTNLLDLYAERQKQQEALTKTNGKIEAAQKKLEAIKRGDWSLLNENMAKGQPTPEVEK